MLLAASFIVSWFSFLMSFAVAAMVVGIVGIFTWAGNMSINLEKWRWRPMLVLGILALLGSQVGLAAANASQHNGAVAAKRFASQAIPDLKSEHLRYYYFDSYTKNVGLTIGQSGCQLPILPLRQVASRHDPTVKWRPVISGGKQQFGLETTDLQSIAKTCSAG